MEQFKIRQDGFKEIRKSILLRTTPILLLATFGGLAISHFTTVGQQSNINVIPIIIPVLMGLLAFGLYRGLNRQKEIYESYKLTLVNNNIIREQLNTPTISIANEDVSEISKNSNGSITIKGNSALNVIVIPTQIDNYDKLEQLLADIKQISTKSSEPLLQKFSGMLSVITIALMATVYISEDKIIVGISGTVLLFVLGHSMYEVQRSKNIDKKSKRGTLWLILVIAAIISIMYFKLTA